MKDDDPFVDNLRHLAQGIDVPEPPRRDEMWVRIDEARRFRRRAARAERVRPVGRWWIAAGLAASLVLGFGLGRLIEPVSELGGSDPVVVSDEAPPESPYEQAATRHLARTEALLTSFSVDAEKGRTNQVADWAQDLLVDTRLLIDSPASGHPRLATLLEDLELILAQLANLTERDPENELELIQAGIQQNDVLVRLRTATSEPTLVGT
ncbi:MAG: hypothetical protein ACREL7_05095 [Longimicrobiales bacterium]